MWTDACALRAFPRASSRRGRDDRPAGAGELPGPADIARPRRRLATRRGGRRDSLRRRDRRRHPRVLRGHGHEDHDSRLAAFRARRTDRRGIDGGPAQRGNGAARRVRPEEALDRAVNGHARAGGFDLLLASEIRFAVPHATFALEEVALGLYPTGNATVLLPRQIPWVHAHELLLTAPADLRAARAGDRVGERDRTRQAAHGAGS